MARNNNEDLLDDDIAAVFLGEDASSTPAAKDIAEEITSGVEEQTEDETEE